MSGSAPQKSARELVLEQLHGHKTHELIPKSGKVVVFDVDLSLRHALDALAEHRLTHAPLWDSSRQEFLTVLVSDDFASLLAVFGHDDAQAAAGNPRVGSHRSVDELSLRETLALVRTPDAVRSFSSLVPDDSLFAAVQAMLERRLHYLPLVDTEGSEPATVLHVLTPLRVLHAIVHSALFQSDPRMFGEPLSALGLCTLLPSAAAAGAAMAAAAAAAGLGEAGGAVWDAGAHGGQQRHAVCCAAPAHAPVWHALRLMAHHAVCALPVVAEGAKLVDVVSTERVLAFARAMPHADLTAPLSAALSTPLPAGLPAVRASDSLHAVLSAFSSHRVERLAVTADSGELVGAVTVLDVLAHFASAAA